MHFVGVLGSGMLPLACLMHERGYKIYGSDRHADSKSSEKLGFTIMPEGEAIRSDVTLGIYSLAIDEDNSDIEALTLRGIPLISRAQLLGFFMSEKKVRISVSGSHGKSTTTAIIDLILQEAGLRPTTVSGAALSDDALYRDLDGDVFLAEGCEYKDSFLSLSPTHQVINSVELDHTDYFESVESLRASFVRAALKSDVVYINIDDVIAREIYSELASRDDYSSRVISYGKSEESNYRIIDCKRDGATVSFAIVTPDGEIKMQTNLIGDFNLTNIACAVAVTHSLGVDECTIARAVKNFGGIKRRMTRITSIDGTDVYYDYAHHPAEVSCVIDALRERYGSVTVVFCPHTYSRTKSLWNEFVAAFRKSNFTILLDIYPAREKRIRGITSKKLVKDIGSSAVYSSFDRAAKLSLSYKTGAIALLGAGEVDNIVSDYIKYGDKYRKEEN